jgi:hypothetical protein
LFVTNRSLGFSLSLPFVRPQERDGGDSRAMTSTKHRARAKGAQRRGRLRRVDDDRRIERAIDARRGLRSPGPGRAWINGREVGGTDPRYVHLSESHD